MVERKISVYKIFLICNYIFMTAVALLCIIPLVHVLAVSFSAPSRAAAGTVTLWPQDFTVDAYTAVLQDSKFWQAMWVSVKRIAIGGVLGLLITVLTAYPLSMSKDDFGARKYYVWYIFITMIFSGGLVPGFLVVYYTGLMDTIWALVIPGLVSAWHVILMLNFFRQLPKELKEAAFVDGASHFVILIKIILPVSKPVLATVFLFIVVGHWNSWFDAVLYMRRPENYPLQTYLQSMLSIDVSKFLSTENQRLMNKISTKTLQASQIFIGAVPILIFYPFLQKYFAKGLVLGSVKG